MRLDFREKIAKDPGNEHACEDCYKIHKSNAIAALSDGASQSFNSRLWADILCQCAIAEPEINREVIKRAIQSYEQQHDLAKLSWAQAAAYRRGSFATLLTVRHLADENKCKLFGVGDSIALVCQKDGSIIKFPLTQSEQFSANPELLSTIEHNNTFLESDSFNQHNRLILDASKIESILLMSDALGQWCYQSIEADNKEWRYLLKIKNRNTFREFVLKKREENLKLDDTTLIHLKFP